MTQVSSPRLQSLHSRRSTDDVQHKCCPLTCGLHALALASMPGKIDKAAEVVGDAVGTVEAAAAVAGSRVRQGLSEAATAIGSSKAAGRVEKQAHPIKKAAAKKAKSIKKTIKRQATVAKRRSSRPRRSARSKWRLPNARLLGVRRRPRRRRLSRSARPPR